MYDYNRPMAVLRAKSLPNIRVLQLYRINSFIHIEEALIKNLVTAHLVDMRDRYDTIVGWGRDIGLDISVQHLVLGTLHINEWVDRILSIRFPRNLQSLVFFVSVPPSDYAKLLPPLRALFQSVQSEIPKLTCLRDLVILFGPFPFAVLAEEYQELVDENRMICSNYAVTLHTPSDGGSPNLYEAKEL